MCFAFVEDFIYFCFNLYSTCTQLPKFDTNEIKNLSIKVVSPFPSIFFFYTRFSYSDFSMC